MILLFFILVGAYGLIALNLYRIQIMHHDFYIRMGQSQYSTLVKINPPRAFIVDRTGKQFLAINKESMCAFCLPKQVKNESALIEFLKQYFPDRLEHYLKHKDKSFLYIERRLTDFKIDLIKNSKIDGIYLVCEPSRYYPMASAGQIIGATNVDNVGIFGIEFLCDEQLAGTPSYYLLQKDARSGYYYFTRKTQQEGQQGEQIQLTIDGDLQFLVHEQVAETVKKFQAKEGAALVMNPDNGHILAMVSIPSCDPNDMKNVDMECAKNKVVTENYELGSVIKVFAALAALDEGVVTPDELIDCEGVATTYVDGRKINTVKSSVADVIPFDQVIEKSNNIGIAKVVNRLGPLLYNHYVRIGFGKKTGIDFPGERTGFVNPPDRWSRQSIFSLSYGYEITATLLQLACAFCMIAADGYQVHPVLIMSEDSVLKNNDKKRLYSPKVIQTIKQILENTVLRGTAKRAQIKGYTVMSKTGTANLLENGVYTDKKGIYTCAGIVQRGDYKRVIVTFIKESPLPNLYASTVAAPLFEHIAQKLLIHDKIV
jgi:cell division protein FtsI (penicillin-binding protein 3)